MTLTPYLNLSGNAEEALNFYREIFGGTVEIMRWGDMPPNPKMPLTEELKNKIMHASLKISDTISLYLSDSMEKASAVENTIFLHVVFDTEAEMRKAYESLSAGGRVNMPVDNTFWGSVYGDLVDRYGTGWGLEYPLET